MTSYFDHNAHKTRPDKTQSATSWDVLDIGEKSHKPLTCDEAVSYQKFIDKFFPKEHTYSDKKAGER